MKDIALHRHSGLRGRPIAIWVFAFSLVVSGIGLAAFKTIDNYWTEVIQKSIPKDSVLNGLSEIFFGVIALPVLWSLLIAGFALVFHWVLNWQTTYGWPRYFFYAFRFSDQRAIVGWTAITLNPSNGKLDAIGQSFEADGSLTNVKCVRWTSDIVSGGTFRGNAACYILYSLNRHEAEEANRRYRDGLLRFRVLQREDLKEDSKWPEPSQLRAEQYVGHQQAVDKDGVWNLAYAESAVIKAETDVEVETALTHDLGVRRESLLEALTNLKENLISTKT